MHVAVDIIPPQGVPVRASVTNEWARTAATLALDAPPTQLDVDLVVRKVEGGVRATGRLAASAPRLCDRCQGAMTVHFDGPVSLKYAPAATATDVEHGLDETEMDVGFFHHDRLEMAEVVSEQLAIWIGDRVRCTDPFATPQGPPRECVVPAHDGGPILKRRSPFAGLTIPE